MTISTYKCITWILALKESMKEFTFPIELISIIIKIYLDIIAPILIYYRIATCTHCRIIDNIWDTEIIPICKDILPQIKSYVWSKRNFSTTFEDNSNIINLSRYCKWTPMILLIPRPLWNNALSNPDIQTIEGVQIFNGKIENNQILYDPLYNPRLSYDYGVWLKKALTNEEFIKTQCSI